MNNILRYKKWYLIFSGLLLLPGVIFLFVFGLNLSIDFTGGSVFRYELENQVSREEISSVFEEQGISVETISFDEDNKVTIRTKPVDVDKDEGVKAAMSDKFENSSRLSFETVGPAIGKETTRRAITAIGWASIGILFYIAFAFRNIPKPYSSFRFGVSAIIAMLHDAIVVLGVFAILGHFLGVEIDMLFITAILTVIGFSVHDSIVVFDRIRENLRKLPKSYSFEDIANYSIAETLSRSIAISMTVVLTLFSLYVLGGQTIKNFVLAMLIGVVSGTYSSIFTASPILVIWEEFNSKKKK